MKLSRAELTGYHAYTDTPDEHLIEGFDPEVALDIGIPVDDASIASHQASGERVAWASQRSDRELQLLIDAAEHEALNLAKGVVKCGKCNTPGCDGCGNS